jgi:hypothetical protein
METVNIKVADNNLNHNFLKYCTVKFSISGPGLV